ncbi:ribonuclease P protein component [Patescibacteria group bacterium]|nr:ribonuclease P protein component [Patescibacteria group bacterium]
MRLTRRTFPTAGARAASTHFSLTLAPAAPGHGGCAVVVPKKVARLSVSRHLLKRRILSVMKPWCSPDFALVVYARTGTSSLSFKDLSHELSSLLTRALHT